MYNQLMARTLTKKQRAFVNIYADTGNGLQSVKRAKYAVKNDATAAVIATENLSKPNVKEELAKLGFDSNNAKRVVGEILNNDGAEHRDRLKAAEQVFKVNSDFAPEKHIVANLEVEATPEIKRLTEIINGIHRGAGISSDGVDASVVGQEAQD